MALKVFKADEASRDYENDFFRKFSGSLVEVFKKEKLDGILVGHPVVPSNKYLKPDCVLITSNRLVIIDFKNHGGKIWLPDDSSFDNTPWKHDGITIDGGSSINPFAQLQKQKLWLEELIGEETYGRFGIACVVCFQQDMTIMNEVPGRYQAWFSVTNRLQCINRIRDIIGVKSLSDNDVDIEKVFSFFDAKPYHDYTPTNFDALDATIKADKQRIEAEKREFAAKRKITNLKKQIKALSNDKARLGILHEQLAKAEEIVKQTEEKTKEALKNFDEKSHALEIASKEAEKAKAEAEKAQAEKEKAMLEAEKSRKNNLTKLITIIIIALVIIVAMSIGLFLIKQKRDDQTELERAQNELLEEDYRNGRKCIPLERASDFVGSTVCVEYYVGYINDNSYYIYLDKEKNGDFQIVIPKRAKIISIAETKERFLNRRVRVNGTIEQYNDSFEIIVNDLDQIELIEQ